MENTKTAPAVDFVMADVVTITREEYNELLYKSFVFDFERKGKIRDIEMGGEKYVTSEDINLYNLADVVDKARAESGVE